MTSELIQFGQCTSQNEADTKEVNWTVPGYLSSIGCIWGWLGFLRSVATDTSLSISTCDTSLPPPFFSVTWFRPKSFLLSTTVMGVLSVTSSQKALAWFPDIEHTRRNDISISLLVSKLSRDLGEGGKIPGVFVDFLWGFTVASLAPKIQFPILNCFLIMHRISIYFVCTKILAIRFLGGVIVCTF